MRLAKYLASAGVASRRAAEQIVRQGRVAVCGETIRDPATDVAAGDQVTVDGRPLREPARGVVYALHKPPGVVSTARDPQGRPTVVELIGSPLRLYPVGRLDRDTAGLILLTNDGALAHQLTHPRFEVEKTYRVEVANGPVPERALRALREGVELDDGPTAAARVRRLGPSVLELTIHEGRNRQVKRMCERVGHPVRRLQRVRFGPLELGGLREGEHRRLTAGEIDLLRAASAGSTARLGADGSS